MHIGLGVTLILVLLDIMLNRGMQSSIFKILHTSGDDEGTNTKFTLSLNNQKLDKI